MNFSGAQVVEQPATAHDHAMGLIALASDPEKVKARLLETHCASSDAANTNVLGLNSLPPLQQASDRTN